MRRSITIVTYNVRHCLGLSGKADLDEITSTLRQALSIESNCNENPANTFAICLQELDRLNPRSGFISQGHEIARQIYANCFPTTTFSFFGLFGFGNALLTNGPIHSTWNRLLPWTGGEPRKVQRIRIGRDDCPVDIYNTHWGLKQSWRLKSAETCATLIRDQSRDIPVIFCGDLNAEIESDEMRLLIDKSGLRSVRQGDMLKTYPSDNPQKKIDHILMSDRFDIEEVEVVQSLASDHLPLVARLSFGG